MQLEKLMTLWGTFVAFVTFGEGFETFITFPEGFETRAGQGRAGTT